MPTALAPSDANSCISLRAQDRYVEAGWHWYVAYVSIPYWRLVVAAGASAPTSLGTTTVLASRTAVSTVATAPAVRARTAPPPTA